MRHAPRYGIEVANGVNPRARIERLRTEQLAFTAAQLTVSVAARYAGGAVGPGFVPFAVPSVRPKLVDRKSMSQPVAGPRTNRSRRTTPRRPDDSDSEKVMVGRSGELPMCRA